MALRKQKDPARVEAANKAWETMRGRYPERYGKNKQNDVADNRTRDTAKVLKDRYHDEPGEVDPKWHLTSQSTLTLKVDLPARERLSDFMDQPWVEKHRPTSLNDCIGDVVGYLKAFAKTGSFPLALIFHGEYGCGKSACAKAMVRDYFVLRGLFKRDATFMDITHATKVTREYDGIFAPALLIDSTLLKSAANAFSGVEVIRTRVQNFMQYTVGKRPKFILIEEADRLGHDCQEVLTSLIEKYPRTRTIWTLNDIDNIMDRIVDRASGGVFEFKKPEPRQIVPRLRQIARSEKVCISEERLKEIAKKAPSVRNAIGMLQQECILVKAVRGRRK
jgi:DNA polymerase III gamma/tau subunit